MAVKLAPMAWLPATDLNGDPLNGYKLFTYIAGTTTKQTTYTTSAGSVAQANPIVLNTRGVPDSPVWLTEGVTYKFVLAPSNDTDPPTAAIETRDNISGINDFTASSDEWVASGLTPTFISTVSFSLIGDVTSLFHVGRRLQTVNSGGTIYSTITASAYTSLTTITVVNDAGVLDAGISAVSYGILSSVNPSVPKIALPDGSTATTQADENNTTKIATTAYVDARALAGTALNLNGLTGLTLSNNGSDAVRDIDIAAGYATDSTNTLILAGTAMTKQIDVDWASGTAAGGFPSALTLTNDTWYRFFLISTTAGVIDYGFDTSATAANLIGDATAYTLYRQIGWIRYGTATILAFIQNGDNFELAVSVADLAGITPGATTETKTLTVPPNTQGKFGVILTNANGATSTQTYIRLRDTGTASAAASTSDFNIACNRTLTSAASPGSGVVHQYVDSSSQVKVSTSTANNQSTYSINTIGWTDARGK